MDLNNYITMFIEESKEHLQTINDELLKLEIEPENITYINEIFRSAHTIKGMAGSMGFDDLATLTHQMENVLDLLRQSKLTITPEIMDIIFQCVDIIEKMVDDIEAGGTGKADVKDIVAKLTHAQNPDQSPPSVLAALNEVAVAIDMPIEDYHWSVINEAKKMGTNFYQVTVVLDENCVMKFVRAFMVLQLVEELGEMISIQPSIQEIEEDKIDNHFTLLMLSNFEAKDIEDKLLNVSEVKEIIISDKTKDNQAEKSETVKVEAEVPVKPSPETSDATATQKRSRTKSIRVDIDKLDGLMNLFSELIIDRGRLEQIARKTSATDLTETVEHMTRISTDLQGIILNMRMVPVEQVFNRFPRMVRDLAKDLNKKIQLIIEGAETELDRTVIDEIGDPLVHLLRNALDHGLESTEDRLASGKPEEGKLLLRAYHSGNHVFIEVADDGKGINREKVLNKAIEREVVSKDEAETLTDQEVYALLFSSGFSTADKISDISGRGVGLDVVKTKIESLGGVISIDSSPGKGSTFLIQLPMTLSIMYCMLIKLEEETYAIPFSSIVEITKLSQDQVVLIQNQKVMQLRGQIIPLVYLKEVLNVPTKESNIEQHQFIVIVRKGDKMVGIVVDSILGQQEIVLKSLGGFLNNLFAISGATILGNGEVALIIDSNQLIS
ncbi:chemotaxis protein CheA [Pseudoneobacillus rhizosphaerae]|uniref:Chemotaxis protein CheA n=1 Tax=Pseudoneobacillus rhizosphaerae TaxID=2880968 RepID=A0A9C7GCM9_9BACI|nr:chemotaxis protein CheA [Pseudoneobacillus rhizosphaerae]CAG9609745.1 Chemotaxis protein CheA [Pseudoneobacillus rhizosphaerae]